MKIILIILLTFITLNLHAQTLFINDETCDITFATTHLATPLEGAFKGADGSSSFDPGDVLHSYLKLSFATSTLTTNDNVLGPDLVRAACFNSAKYPTIELSSYSIFKLSEANHFLFNGALKVRGIVRPISFPFTAKANVGGYDFNFTFAFKKNNFGLHCGATGNRFKISVRAYAKTKIVE